VQKQKEFSQFPPSKTCHTTGKGKSGYFLYVFIKLDTLSSLRWSILVPTHAPQFYFID